MAAHNNKILAMTAIFDARNISYRHKGRKLWISVDGKPIYLHHLTIGQFETMFADCTRAGKVDDSIAVSWYIDDVKQRCVETSSTELTDDEARYILECVDKYHDANIGVNWENLDYHTDEFLRSKGGSDA